MEGVLLMKKIKSVDHSLSRIESKAVGIVYRIHTPTAVSAAKKLVRWLQSKGYSAYTAPEQKLISGSQLIKGKSDWKKIGLMIVLGGDGTYLRAVRLLEGLPIPILAFNMGSLGFLTVHPGEQLFSLVQKALQGHLIMRPRGMMTIKLKKSNKLTHEYMALNDLVIERGSYSQLINIGVESDGFNVNDVKADGIIISTPTGSTAYNLAAGGPILHPDSKVLVVTPVAPHSLSSRPFIFPDDHYLSFHLKGLGQKAHLVVDGQKVLEIDSSYKIQIKRCTLDHWVVREPSFNYFSLLREKLKFGNR